MSSAVSESSGPCRVVGAVNVSVEDLEERACRGEAVAFGQLIRIFDGDLRAAVWSVVRSAEATDDVMQASYERAFRSIGAFKRESSLKTWLHSICYRAAIDHVRYESRRRHERIEDVRVLSEAVEVDQVVLDRIELAEALGRLAPSQRAAVMLTTGLGYSFEEAAAITGMQRGTVASRAARARRKLERVGRGGETR